MRYMDYKSLDEVDRVTPREYALLMTAVRLKRIDQDYWVHWQAFQNQRIKAEKKAGKNRTKPVYSNFKRFYDYQKEEDKVLKREETDQRLKDIKEIMQRTD